MIIPYSTDAPIYYFPWMTVGLIVVNAITFVVTGQGYHSQGWMLTYGRGLHPLEWIAYSFLHFGAIHLIGNMFFLWSFGIVVEGKLGWWKFLAVYLGIGICGGILIQTAMLGYVNEHWASVREPAWRGRATFSENSLFAQDNKFVIDKDDVGNAPADPIEQAGEIGVMPDIGQPDNQALQAGGQNADEPQEQQAGAGGASLIIYGLMAIVLIWAPRNEVHCIWFSVYRIATIELEYLYFCGFYIVIEVLSAIFSSRGFEISSEAGHATGAMIGFGLGTLFVKQQWVDCENWDLFSIMAGKHGAVNSVGEWHSYYTVDPREKQNSITALGEQDANAAENSAFKAKKKKKKAMPKLVQLESLDDLFHEHPVDDSDEALPWQLEPGDFLPTSRLPEFTAPISRKPDAKPADPRRRISDLLSAGEFREAFEELRLYQEFDAKFRLDQEELRILSNGLFKTRAAKEAAPLLQEYIERFADEADRSRIKLAVLYVKFLRRPIAALKLLSKVEPLLLPENYRQIFKVTAREAQSLISDGVTDAPQ